MKKENLKLVAVLFFAIPLLVVLFSFVSLRAGSDGVDLPLVLFGFFALAEGVIGLTDIKLSLKTFSVSVLSIVSILVWAMVLDGSWNLAEIMPMKYYLGVGKVAVLRLCLLIVSASVYMVKKK
jgi:hypothetical protein